MTTELPENCQQAASPTACFHQVTPLAVRTKLKHSNKRRPPQNNKRHCCRNLSSSCQSLQHLIQLQAHRDGLVCYALTTRLSPQCSPAPRARLSGSSTPMPLDSAGSAGTTSCRQTAPGYSAQVQRWPCLQQSYARVCASIGAGPVSVSSQKPQ